VLNEPLILVAKSKMTYVTTQQVLVFLPADVLPYITANKYGNICFLLCITVKGYEKKPEN
jgi:hypothetical protein